MVVVHGDDDDASVEVGWCYRRRVERNVEWKKRNGPWNVEVLLFLEDPSLEVPWV